jgi:hypothetical protein
MNGPDAYRRADQLTQTVTARRATLTGKTVEDGVTANQLDLLTALAYAIQANTAAHICGPAMRAVVGNDRKGWLEVIT